MVHSKVWYTQISREASPSLISEKLLRMCLTAGVFEKIKENSLVGLKVHFGDRENRGYIKPDYLRDLVKALKERNLIPFFIETATLYHGKRMFAPTHIELAWQHGFGRLNIPIIMIDGLRGEFSKDIEVNLKHFKNVKIAGSLEKIDYVIFLSHLTGHMLTGFGATIKNMGMGCASKEGKIKQHCEIMPQINGERCRKCRSCIKICPVGAIKIDEKGSLFIDARICTGCAECLGYCSFKAIKINWSQDTQTLQEKMCEYALGVKKVVESFYINLAIFITKDCDCISKEIEPVISDLGILASFDPLAVDKATIDILNKRENRDPFRDFYPNVDYSIVFEYGNKIGLGNLEYELIYLE